MDPPIGGQLECRVESTAELITEMGILTLVGKKPWEQQKECKKCKGGSRMNTMFSVKELIQDCG